MIFMICLLFYLLLSFADETNIFVQGKNIVNLIRTMNKVLCKLSDWIFKCKKKTNCMNFQL